MAVAKKGEPKDFADLVEKYLISDKELQKLKKSALKDESLKKVLIIYESFQDALIGKPLFVMLNRIDQIKKAESYVTDYFEHPPRYKNKDNKGRNIQESVGFTDDAPTPQEFYLQKLQEKDHALFERITTMTKELPSLIDGALKILHAKNRILGKDAVSEIDQSDFSNGSMWNGK